MFDCEDNQTGEFGQSIGSRLRAPEKLATDFESRLMAQVRRAGPLNARPRYISLVRDWATQRRSIHVSPLAALAVAAGFAGIISLATIKLAISRTYVQYCNVDQPNLPVQNNVVRDSDTRVV